MTPPAFGRLRPPRPAVAGALTYAALSRKKEQRRSTAPTPPWYIVDSAGLRPAAPASAGSRRGINIRSALMPRKTCTQAEPNKLGGIVLIPRPSTACQPLPAVAQSVTRAPSCRAATGHAARDQDYVLRPRVAERRGFRGSPPALHESPRLRTAPVAAWDV